MDLPPNSLLCNCNYHRFSLKNSTGSPPLSPALSHHRARMSYGRLGCSNSETGAPEPQSRRRWFLLLGLVGVVLILLSVISVAFVVTRARTGQSLASRAPSQAIARTCGLTRYPALCVSSLLDFPGALDASERDLVHITLNMTLHRVGRALYGASAMAAVAMDTRARAAYDDCMELLDGSADQLSQSLLVVAPSAARPRPRGASDEDVVSWLSAALTNQDTCTDGLDGVADNYVRTQMGSYLQDLSELVSNCLAIFATASKNQDFSGIPIQNKKRRKLLAVAGDEHQQFPQWVTKNDRRLLQIPATEIQADFVVSKDGTGTHKSIADAVKAAPEYRDQYHRIIIYVKAGRYKENIKVGRKKTNLMFIGDGKGVTVVTGSRSVVDNYTTFRSATFAATGWGFIMRDMTVENSAGPWKHQAVALRVGADHAVVYRCSVFGYQDTLYVHSLRQFYRECDIYGTVDFVFGNAAVVLQNCTFWARKPLPMQKNTITAQNRKDPHQNTGISIHACRVLATAELEVVRWKYPTFLGRPWKMYSRVVYMLSYMGDHVDPAGWLPWNDTFALDTLYYGEYMNYGPGAALRKRVTWPGYRVIKLQAEANEFTVREFISGSDWLPSTGVAFLAGLSV